MIPANTTRESARRISDCVTALLKDQPFFGSLALRLPIRADPSRQTLASDGREIRYSPEWIAATDADYVKTALARVVLACALKHHTRRAERDPRRWQHASQLVTHHLLQDAGFRLPPEAEAWEGLSVEQAYDRLPEPEQDNQSPPQRDPADSPQDSPPTAPCAPEQNDPEPGNEPTDADDTPDDSTDNDDAGNTRNDPAGNDDHNADADPDADSDTRTAPGTPDRADTGEDGEPASLDPSGTGEILDAAPEADTSSSPDAPDFTDEEQNWDEAMHQALNLAKAQGKAPGALTDTVQSAHHSRLDWLTLLRRYMTDASKSDYTWSVPNHRFIDSGLYLPSLHSYGVSSIAVLIDTSGSLPAETLANFWTAIRDLASEIRPETIFVLQIDTAVRDAAQYDSAGLPTEITLKGRGGTDFRPGFEWLDEEGIRPGVCLYLTDMLCSSYPQTPPDFPMIWLNYGEPPDDWNREPWGERIDIPPDAAH